MLLAAFFAVSALAGERTAPILPALGPAAMPSIQAPALPQLTLPAVPIVPMTPLAPQIAQPGLEIAQPVLQAAAPQDGRPPEPAAFKAAYDGAKAPMSAEAVEAFAALPVPAQLSASGWYGGAPILLPWAREHEGDGWMKFYHGLYRALAADGPKGYRVDGPRGPVFHLGGHDVVQAVLGVARTYADGEVNLYGRFANKEEHLELWTTVMVDSGAPGTLEVMVNPESTPSLARMADARRVQDNILLKWNLVSLTPEGIEIRALDTPTKRDLLQRRLRLETGRGPLSGYEAHYNLIVAYRAMRETARPWTFDPQTRSFFAESLRTMPVKELETALSLAAQSPALGGAQSPKAGMENLIGFIERELGGGAAARARRVAREMPRAEGGVLEDGIPKSLLDAAEPWTTENQLSLLKALPPAPRARFALIGDSEPGRFWFSRVLFNIPGVFARLLKKADAEDADFIFQLGDMVSRGVVKNYERFFGLLSSLRPAKPYLTTIGNHDRRKPHGVTDARLYRALFGRALDYAFDRGGARFVVLDSSAGRVTPEQLDWLDEQLDAPGPKIVFTHMPPAYLGEWTDIPGRKGIGGFNRGAARLREIVERRKVARVYVGHIHAFATLERGGVRYVLTGGGGSALFPAKVKDKFHHYLLVEAGPDGIKEIVKLANGAEFPLEWGR